MGSALPLRSALRNWTAYCLAWTLSAARLGIGKQQLTPLRIEYLQPRTNLRQLEKHFGCEAVCGAARNGIVFRAADATIPFVTSNSDLLELLAPQFEEQMKQFNTEDTFVELVRRAIQDRLTGYRPFSGGHVFALYSLLGSRYLPPLSNGTLLISAFCGYS